MIGINQVCWCRRDPASLNLIVRRTFASAASINMYFAIPAGYAGSYHCQEAN
jgi:hypothetical protein